MVLGAEVIREGMRPLSWIPGTRLHRGGSIESQLRFLVESVVGAASISGACGIAAKKSGVFRFGGEVGVGGPQGVRQNAEENDVLLVEAVECGYGSRGAREGGKVLFI